VCVFLSDSFALSIHKCSCIIIQYEGEYQDLNEKINECTNEEERVEGPSTPEISSINENMEPIITDMLDNSERQNCTPDISRDDPIDTSNVNTTLTSTADTTNDEQVTKDFSTMNNTNRTRKHFPTTGREHI